MRLCVLCVIYCAISYGLRSVCVCQSVCVDVCTYVCVIIGMGVCTLWMDVYEW